MECNRKKAIHALEANVLRYGKIIQDSLRLLRSAREDGGLTKVQSDALDRLIAKSEGVMTGQDETLYGLDRDERQEVTEFLKANMLDFVEFLEKPERGTLIIRRLGQSCG